MGELIHRSRPPEQTLAIAERLKSVMGNFYDSALELVVSKLRDAEIEDFNNRDHKQEDNPTATE